MSNHTSVADWLAKGKKLQPTDLIWLWVRVAPHSNEWYWEPTLWEEVEGFEDELQMRVAEPGLGRPS